MVSLFKEKSAASVFWVVLLSLTLHIDFFSVAPVIITEPGDGLLYHSLKGLQLLPSFALSLLYHLIVLMQAFFLNFILNESRMFAKPVHTTALAYILLTGILPEWGNISSALVANFFVIWVVYHITILYNNAAPKNIIFNMGFVAGIGVLLYYPLMPLLLVIYFAIIGLRPFKINEWFILFLGFITPIYLYSGYLFLNDRIRELTIFPGIFEWHLVHPGNPVIAGISIAAIITAVSYGVYFWQISSSRMVIQVRRNWFLLFAMMVIFFPVLFFIQPSWPFTLINLTVPAAAFVSYGFTYPKKNIGPAIFFWILLVLALHNNWML